MHGGVTAFVALALSLQDQGRLVMDSTGDGEAAKGKKKGGRCSRLFRC
ncbi:MAG: hypothetical protein H6994_12710 [Pseudomonadales bacterium]|nr:hypothetical protein [Pseudomonadales bacterium]